jgi:flagellar biosynthetic protein FliP
MRQALQTLLTGRRARCVASLAVPTLVLGLCVLSPLSATAQELTLNFGDQGALSVRVIQILLVLTALSLAPGILVMVTCFPFLITVLAILRQALGLMQSPPNMLLVSLALFLTYFVMEPVFVAAWQNGIAPIQAGTMSLEDGLLRAADPFRAFMAMRVDDATFESLASLRPDPPAGPAADAPLSVLIPAFMLSEVSRAFQIGFLIFLPFLIIDLVVAAVLMSMGMMMVPPAVVAMPFKLSFFVLADGWRLLSEALVRSYF